MAQLFGICRLQTVWPSNICCFYFDVKLIDVLFSVNRASGGKGGIKGDTLEDDENSDEGDEEDYTVYECHGLAPVSSSQNISDYKTYRPKPTAPEAATFRAL